MSRAALPAGYVTGRERGASIVALPFALDGVRALVREHGTLAAAAQADRSAQAFRGRGAAYRIELAGADVVVRHYRRGGSVATLLGDRYLRLGMPRPLRELSASASARGRGVATPEAVCTVTYDAGPFYRADFVTRYVPDSRDLAEAVLGAARLDEPGRAAAWRAAGALLQRAFAAGVEHADLNMRNILIAGSPVGAQLLDLDRAVVRDGAVSVAARDRMLARLHRSRRKLEAQLGHSTTAAELNALQQGLCG